MCVLLCRLVSAYTGLTRLQAGHGRPRAYLHIIYTYIHRYMHTYMHVYIYVYMQRCYICI